MLATRDHRSDSWHAGAVVARWLPRGLAEGLGGEPTFSELAERDLARVGVDVGAAQNVGSDRDDEPLSVLLAGEGPGAFPAIRVVVPGLPAAALAVADCPDASPVDILLPEVLDMCHAGFPFVTAALRHGGLRCDRGASRRGSAGWRSDRPRRWKSYSSGRRRGRAITAARALVLPGAIRRSRRGRSAAGGPTSGTGCVARRRDGVRGAR